MPERLSLATVATCAALAGAAFGGAYALAHDGPAEPAPAPGAPTAIRVAQEPIGELRRVSPLPALQVPPPQREPAQPEPVAVEETPEPAVPAPTPVVPAATPAPTPTPTPTPQPTPEPAPTKRPLTFDDSG